MSLGRNCFLWWGWWRYQDVRASRTTLSLSTFSRSSESRLLRCSGGSARKSPGLSSTTRAKCFRAYDLGER